VAWAFVIVLTYLAVFGASAASVIRGIIVLANGYVDHGIAWIALGAGGITLIVLLLVTVFTLLASSPSQTQISGVRRLERPTGDDLDET
jgi:hypothetical protein